MSETSASTTTPSGKKLKPWMFLVAAVFGILIGLFALESVPTACLFFLVFVYIAIAMQLGWTRLVDLFSNHTKPSVVVSLLCTLLLVFGPLYVEPLGRYYWKRYVKDWKRDMDPSVIYYIWSVESSGFSQDQELVERWNPGGDNNDVNTTTMISAAWLLGIEADVMAPFDSTELEPGEAFTLIVFESMRVEKEFPSKDPKGAPTKRKVSQLRITFITPASIRPVDLEDAGTGEDKEAGEGGKKPAEESEDVVAVNASFKRHVATVTSLDDSIFAFISNGLSNSIRKGDKIGRVDIEKLAHEAAKRKKEQEKEQEKGKDEKEKSKKKKKKKRRRKKK